MRKDFRRDLVEVESRLKNHRPLALTRFGDGELKILLGEPIDLRSKANGEFLYDPDDPQDDLLRRRLKEAFTYAHRDYWVGIGCPCCIGPQQSQTMRLLSGLPEQQLTWANLFVNANYPYFKECVVPLFENYQVFLVANERAMLTRLPFAVSTDWRVETNAWRADYALIDEIRCQTRGVTGALFLFCAGPLGNLLVHQLWQANPQNTYLNIGSTLDPWLFGDQGFTRGYLRGGPTLQKYCVWDSADRSQDDSPSEMNTSPRSGVPALPARAVDAKRPLTNGGERPSTVQTVRRPGITVILTAYRRPQLLQRQVEAIRAQTFAPAALWIWANEPDELMEAELATVNVDRVVRSSTNGLYHGRFALALTAPTEHVALFDDDTIPGAEWFHNCLETMDATPGILGTAGVRLTGPGYEGRTLHGWHSPSATTTGVDLVGHAWFLRTRWLKHLFAEPAITGTNGEDIELSARAWRLGRVPTWCPPHPPGQPTRWGSLFGTELGGDQVAASRRATHLAERDQIVKAEMRAGWRPLYLRADQGSRESRTLPERVFPARGVSSNGSAHEKPSKHGQAGGASEPAHNDRSNEFFLDLIPTSAQRVLCLGSEGATIAAAIELRQSAQARALAGDVDHLNEEFAAATFDCIVLGNALEHTRRPASLLTACRRWLLADGALIASVSNVRHHGTVAAMLHGRMPLWRFGHSATEPVQFFTRRELEKLLYRAGFRAQDLKLEPGVGWQAWHDEGRPGALSVEGLELAGLAPHDAEEFYAAKIHVRAEVAQKTDYGLTSIVLVTHNQLGYTHQCLESIRFRTDEPYELIVVDNGSTDGTVEYLKSQTDVRLFANPDNRGFPAGANQGIEAARGDQVLLLNNDTLVTTGWLDRLLRSLHSDAAIGLVGPCSNQVSGPQQAPVTYSDLASLDGFAWEWGKAHHRETIATGRLVGFCLLIRREVIDRIGFLDERFGLGNFEDDDYCLRAAKAGFKAVIARDAFVHHFGHVTFRATGVDFGGLLAKNETLFLEKWKHDPKTGPQGAASLPRSGAPPRGKLAIRKHKSGGLLLVRESICLSACLIVRDNENTIRPCLESIRPWVDEIVVVDTGSKDKTPEIAKSLGARLFHFPWCDDFSAARNVSLEHARGQWLFWMDSDDTIDTESGRQLPELARCEVDPSVLGYVMQVHCPGGGPDAASDVTVVDHVKMFRNRPDLRFEGRIHEQVLPAIRRAGGETAWSDVFVVHSGSDNSPAGRRRKQDRDLRILKLDLAERPDHPFVLFNLGMTYADIGEHGTAATYLVHCLEVSDPHESHVRKAYALLVGSYVQLKELEKAESICARGRELFPRDPELLFRQGILAHQAGRLDAAVQAYLEVLSGDDERHFSSIDRGIVGFKARHNLALVYEDMAELAKAEAQWRLVLAEMPNYRDGWRGLIENLIRQKNYPAAEADIERMAGLDRLRGEAYRARSQLAKEQGNLEAAKQHLVDGANLCQGEEEPLRTLCQFLFEHGEPREAKRALAALVALDPLDASARHNLGTTHLRMGDPSAALSAYDEAIRIRPAEATTHLYRGYALEQLGQLDQALAAFEQAKELAPGDHVAADAIGRLRCHRLGPTQSELLAVH